MVTDIFLAISSETLGVGTVSTLLIAFSAAVFKLYGKTQDERKESAEDRVDSKQAELDRTRADWQRDRESWLEEKTRLEHRLALAESELRDCWQSQIDRRQGKHE